MMEMYVTNSLYLNAEKVSEKVYLIHLSNGEKVLVEKDPIHNGGQWAWKVDNQIFGKDDYALRYLKQLIGEKLTGKRFVFRAKGRVPEICGVDGCACRAPGKCNRALCEGCPVADAFFAKRDGVELIYAI